MSRISVTRILRRFREAGILRQAYRRIEVLQPHRLLEVFGSLDTFWTDIFYKSSAVFLCPHPQMGACFFLETALRYR